MNNSHEAKILFGIALLSIIAISPLTTSVFAQYSSVNSEIAEAQIAVTEETSEGKTSTEDVDVQSTIEEGLSAAPIEQQFDIVDPYSESLEPYVVQPDVLKFEGATEGWMIIDNIAYVSSVVLTGTSFHVENGIWQIDADGRFEIVDRFADLNLTGFVVDNVIVLHGRGVSDDGHDTSVFLRGYFAPTTEYGKFAMAFTHASLKYIDDRGNQNDVDGKDEIYPLVQSGMMTVDATAITDEPTSSKPITNSIDITDNPQAEKQSKVEEQPDHN